jgi:hypothetical protein
MAGASVVVPIRLSADSDALAVEGTDVDKAVEAPVSRALSKSKLRLDADGALRADTVLNSPEFVWTGADVPPAERKRLERELRAGIEKAILGTGVAEPGAKVVGAPKVEKPVQPAVVELPVTEEVPAPEAAPAETEEQWRDLSLVYVAFGEDVLQALVEEAVQKWGPVSPGVSEFGLIWRMGEVWWILMRSPSGREPRAFTITDVHTWLLRGSAKEANWERVSATPAPGRTRIWIIPALTPAQRVAALREQFGDGIKANLEEIARVGGVEPGADLEKEINGQVDAELERRAKTLPGDTAGLIAFDIGGVKLAVPASAAWLSQFSWKGVAELLPVTAPAPVPEEEGGEERAGATPVAERYLDEPSLEELGPAADELRRQMADIAPALGLVPSPWAGGFAMAAARALRYRAHEIAEADLRREGKPAKTTATPKGDGNVRLVEFEAYDSQAVFDLQRLAGQIAPLRRFSEEIARVYRAHRSDQWTGPAFSHWLLRFSIDFHSTLHWSVANEFMSMCRILLMQLLVASRAQIEARKAPVYAELFERLIRPRLEDVASLQMLREQLELFIFKIPNTYPRAAYGETYTLPVPSDWYAARRGLGEALKGGPFHDVVESVGKGTIETRGYQAAIRDTHGRLWSMDDLDRAAIAARGVAEAVDPFVKQLTDLPEIVERFRASSDPAKTLAALINEMAAKNEEQRHKVLYEPEYAFKAGRLVPGRDLVLRGIHEVADKKLAPAARDDESYREGVRLLVATGVGRQDLIQFVEFAGITLIAVVCPPLGVVAGVAAAAYHYSEASEREELYEALIDPEKVMSWAEVEAEMFAAKLGLALSFLGAIPELLTVGRALGAGRAASAEVIAAGSRTAVTEEAKKDLAQAASRVASRTFVRTLEREAAQTVIDGLNRSLVKAFVRDLAIGHGLNLVLGPIMGRWMREVEEEAFRTGPVGGLEGAAGAIKSLGLQAPTPIEAKADKIEPEEENPVEAEPEEENRVEAEPEEPNPVEAEPEEEAP